MFEEDHAPVTLSEIYHQAASCQRSVEFARRRSRVFDQFFPFAPYTDIIITGCGSSYDLAVCASFAWSELLERPVAAIASSELAHFPEHYLAASLAVCRQGFEPGRAWSFGADGFF